MKITTVAAYLLWLAAGALLMRLELRSDDAGVIAFIVLATSFVLGLLHPRRAWQWALLVGPCVPAADLIFGKHPAADATKTLLLVAAFVITLGLAGAYAGVLLRRVIGQGLLPQTRP